MPAMKWDDAFKVGVFEFDEAHKQLVNLLNKIFDGFVSGAVNDELGEILNELVGYAVDHFNSEERWMEATHFPGLDEHRREHQLFTCKVCALQKRFAEHKPVNVLELLQYLESWFMQHIVTADAEYADYRHQEPLQM